MLRNCLKKSSLACGIDFSGGDYDIHVPIMSGWWNQQFVVTISLMGRRYDLVPL